MTFFQYYHREALPRPRTGRVTETAPATCRDRVTHSGVTTGNQLEALRGDRRGHHSIRINDQWRICFMWRDGHCYDVEIVDYH